MLNNPDLALEDALGRHQERIAAAQRRHLVSRVRRANKERKARQKQRLTTPSDSPTRTGRNADLAYWLARIGDNVSQYSTEDLDGSRRPALGVLVDELLSAARESGADVPSSTAGEDAAVVVLRTLGRIAISTSGQSVPVSRRRAWLLQTALDSLVDGHQLEHAHGANIDLTRSSHETDTEGEPEISGRLF